MTNPVLSTAGWVARWLPMPLKRSLYRFKPLASAIRGALNRAAPLGLTQIEVAGGNLAGFQLSLELQTEKDYWLGTYEPELQAAIADLARPGMVVYDVGANIGYISLMLARCVGQAGKVYAFEALPSNVSRLRLNLELNKLVEQVIVIPAAVVDAPRKVRFMLGPSGGMGKAQGSAGRQDIAYTESIEVDGLSLDSFVFVSGNPVPHLVKIDIEGGEVLALPGMSRLLSQAPPLILLELHGPQALAVAWQVFKDHAYRVCRMQPGYPEVSNSDELDWKAYLVAFPGEIGSPHDR